jgi:hypothetical protein
MCRWPNRARDWLKCGARANDFRRFGMEQFNITMRKFLKEAGVTSQQAIERVVREENLAGKGRLKVKMVLTAEGTGLRHVVEGEIDLADAQGS